MLIQIFKSVQTVPNLEYQAAFHETQSIDH